MARVAEGDAESFAEVYDEVAGMAFGVALRVIRDPALAEEASQEALVRVWRAAAKFDPSQASVRGWVATIAHRQAVDAVRREARMRQRHDRLEQDRTLNTLLPSDVDLRVERAVDIDVARTALDVLTDLQREAIELAYFEAMTYSEVARHLDVPLGTIKTRIRDGLIRLRSHMEDGDDHD